MKFLLDTEAVSSAASGIGKTATNIASIADKVGGYSVEDEDFNFSGAKSALATSINACADRVKTAQTLIASVIDAHTTLQTTLTFENFLNPPKEENTEDDSARTTTNTGSPSSRSRRSSGGGSRSSGTLANVVSGAVTGVASAAIASGLTIGEEKTTKTQKFDSFVTGPKVVKSNINKMSYANVNSNNLTKSANKVIEASENTEGYLKINGRYVVACDSNTGNVGDVLRFTSSDGKVVECVVGVNTVTKDNQNKMFLLVDDKNKNTKAVDFSNLITDKNTTITTIGNYKDNNLTNETTVNSTPAASATESSNITATATSAPTVTEQAATSADSVTTEKQTDNSTTNGENNKDISNEGGINV